MYDELKITTPQEAAIELLRRKRARESLIDFAAYTMPTYVADPFHHHVAEGLDEIARGDNNRLMIFAPPQHGKSQLSTRHFPAYFMSRQPQKHVISASYNADFAKGFGRDVRDIVTSQEYNRIFPDIHIRSDNRAADEWQLEQGGKYYAVGVGTGTTGKGAHLFLIDDPIKDRKEADSPTVREDHWNWYKEVVFTRLQEESAIVLTLTRWHHDDLAGRLIRLMNEGKGRPWKIIRLPALATPRRQSDGTPILNDDGTVPGDPLRRRPNDPLAPNRFSYRTLLEKQEVLGSRSWSALFQQEPIAQEGGMFRKAWFKIPEALPPKRVKARAWDLAASTDGDYTVGVLMSKDTEGRFYIENIIRMRGSPLDVERLISASARDDGRMVRIHIPQDPGQAGKSQAEHFVRRLAGYAVKTNRPTGSKETRSSAFAAQAEAGNVFMCPGAWNEAFIDELETFPLGEHDDQVDAASDAFNALLGPRRAAILEW